MRIQFLIDPTARKRDLERVTASYNLPKEGLKYIQWRNEYTVSNFFYTWNMISDYFVTLLQDLNKTAILYGDAPNPLLHTETGTIRLLSIAKDSIPLVINFGSCT